jgi:HEPN domain-containing protein
MTHLFSTITQKRGFRDRADEDYIAARLACRAELVSPYLWSSPQALEKYLKCILLFRRVPAKRNNHSLSRCLKLIVDSGLNLQLTTLSKEFVEYLDSVGNSRYLEASPYVRWKTLLQLDRAVWEIRRFCAHQPEEAHLEDGVLPPRVRIEGGLLEAVIDNKRSPARRALLWQNGFFGSRRRQRVLLPSGWHVINSPLHLAPHKIDELAKFVYVKR